MAYVGTWHNGRVFKGKKMKLKTNELQGAALDWAVAKCLPDDTVRIYFDEETGEKLFLDDWEVPEFSPSTDWAQGGPIIEREWLDVTPWPNESREDMRWHCQQHDTANDFAQYGPTVLIAAMRCYVASNLGDEIEVPDEL
jgi:hypothetical protein